MCLALCLQSPSTMHTSNPLLSDMVICWTLHNEGGATDTWLRLLSLTREVSPPQMTSQRELQITSPRSLGSEERERTSTTSSVCIISGDGLSEVLLLHIIGTTVGCLQSVIPPPSSCSSSSRGHHQLTLQALVIFMPLQIFGKPLKAPGVPGCQGRAEICPLKTHYSTGAGEVFVFFFFNRAHSIEYDREGGSICWFYERGL